MLLSEEKHRTVVSILGMSGLGKTTLVKNVYNSDDVNSVFMGHAWTHASQEYDIRELLLGIVKSVVSFFDDKQRRALEGIDAASEAQELRFLNQTESWDLFVWKIFKAKSTPAGFLLELEGLGRQIVGKCGGFAVGNCGFGRTAVKER
ncbi:putative disease resistance RPP13-like protein 3 [Malania oleifera]|uniref:putative disease resistance RPP13-like protein 3 n=1 Tax=Malania oleifera TaxID=397392 RepID=UPI0025AE52EA|nr:putative disease resistance RPP13-like protein 3 [Malania oleifera]